MNQETPALYAMVLRKSDWEFIFGPLSAKRFTRTDIEDSLLPVNSDDEMLGSALIETLWVDTDYAELKADPPPDTLAEEYLAWFAPLYEGYCHSEQRVFEQLYRCDALLANGLITLTPTYQESPKDWTQRGISPEHKVVIAVDSTEEMIGAAVRRVFEHCRSDVAETPIPALPESPRGGWFNRFFVRR
ncbi:hypothetical protein GY26_04330 [Gammaproteobacteria bacterium MFB021]|nr:hypothetical protein GY26_04330 [Gammaproteobacteria bacterium MFB021]